VKVISVFSIKSLRAKTVLWALLPTALVLAVVAIITLHAYEQVARDVVQQRDTELARVSAARLSENLGQYSRLLQSVAAGDDVQSMEPARLSAALENAQNQLYVFDAGVVAYNDEGVALWSQPFAAERWGTDFPVTSEFDKVRRTLRPTFSNVFKDAISGEEVILAGASHLPGKTFPGWCPAASALFSDVKRGQSRAPGNGGAVMGTGKPIQACTLAAAGWISTKSIVSKK